MTNTKKLIAIVMSTIMLLGIFAGCNKAPADQGSTETTGNVITTPIAKGMLVLNAGASVNISYDGDGLVLNVEGADDNGSILASEYEDYLGKPCAEAVVDLVRNAIGADYLNSESNDIIIKQAVGSALPGSNFLETVVADAKAAAEAANVQPTMIQITEAELDEDGYINLEKAKELLLAELNITEFDTLDGTTAPIDGSYCFAITVGDMEGTYIINGVTGDVFEGVLDGFQTEEELDEEFIPEDTIEEPVDDVTLPPETTAVTNPVEDGSNSEEA